MVRRGQKNLSTKLRSASYLFITRNLLILGLLGSFCIMTTLERVQRFSGTPVNVDVLMIVLWMVNIVLLTSFILSFDFCPSGFTRHL